MKGLIPGTVAFYMQTAPMRARFGAFLDLAKVENIIPLEECPDPNAQWMAEALITDLSAQGVSMTHLLRHKVVKAIIMFSEFPVDETSVVISEPRGSSRKIAIHIRNVPRNADAFIATLRTVLKGGVPVHV